MYCLKCRRLKETENIATAFSRNGRLMKRDQCVTCGKIKTQFDKKKEVAGESFLNILVNKLSFKMHLQVITLLARNKTLQKTVSGWNGTPKE